MEVSPWKTPYQLWLEKTSGELPAISAYQKRGMELEELARQTFEKKTGIIMFPKVVLHPTFDWMMASLDGIDIDGQSIVEIKCPGQIDHDTAKAGKIPEKYIPQLQHQLAVTGLKLACYFSFDGTDGVILEMKRDNDYIEPMLCIEKAFWEYIESCTPPPLKDRDFVNRQDLEWRETSQKWLETQKRLVDLGSEEKILRESLIRMAGNQSCHGGGIKLTRSVRKGAVQYAQVPELQGIDLEKYRKSPSEYWRLSAF